MSQLNSWLERATRNLSKDSTARVRAEIQEHYDANRDAALEAGKTQIVAEQLALTALGDAATVNCQYRNVMLTSAEASMLRQGNWEARAVCSRAWVKWSLLAIPVALLAASAGMFANGKYDLAQTLLAGGIALSVVLIAPLFLPIYTPRRARIFRRVKWIVFPAALLLVFGQESLKMSWLFATCLWPAFHLEMTRNSLRRKLPVAQWPKQLYL